MEDLTREGDLYSAIAADVLESFASILIRLLSGNNGAGGEEVAEAEGVADPCLDFGALVTGVFF